MKPFHFRFKTPLIVLSKNIFNSFAFDEIPVVFKVALIVAALTCLAYCHSGLFTKFLLMERIARRAIADRLIFKLFLSKCILPWLSEAIHASLIPSKRYP